MNKSVYFILFLHVNINDLLMRHVCGFKKKKKLALLPNKDNAALNDNNHLQDDKMKMGGEWLNGIE